VHQNFGTFTLEKTAEEIFTLYQTASAFIDVIPVKLQQYLATIGPNPQDVIDAKSEDIEP